MPGQRLERACTRIGTNSPWVSVPCLYPSLPLPVTSSPFSPEHVMNMHSGLKTWFKCHLLSDNFLNIPRSNDHPLTYPTPPLAHVPSYLYQKSLHSFIYMSVFHSGSDGEESACNARDPGSISGSGRSPREGIGCPLQYSYLENPMDRGAWWTIVHGVTKSWTQLSH